MGQYVFGLREITNEKHAIAGGKAANLAELFRIEGIHVPDGFCISTTAFTRVIGQSLIFKKLLEELSSSKVENRAKISVLSKEIRSIIEGTAIPEDLAKEIVGHLVKTGEKDAYAVRSSAISEDMPRTSFAGQLDTFLNLTGKEAIFKQVSKCWSSLYAERAIFYCLQNGLDLSSMKMAVVVQKMIFPEAAGILFTADPVTSNRKILSIDAGFGLGEALVSGLANADVYKVQNGKIIDKKISPKKVLINAQDGGTTKQEVRPERQNSQVLNDEEILQLSRIGRRIEAHFGRPQDIEWCLADGIFHIVQSRPIASLFPIPVADDMEKHVYISVGHQQMMTDPIRPLGISFWQLTAARPMFVAGGRFFVDVSGQLASSDSREKLLNMMDQHEPLIRDALETLITRGDFINTLPDESQKQIPEKKMSSEHPASGFIAPAEFHPSIVSDLIRSSEESIEQLKKNIQRQFGTSLFDFILGDIGRLRQSLFDPQSIGIIMTALGASSWINEKMEAWLGEKNAADILSQSVPNNITSDMGLALMDVADAICDYPEAIAYLQHAKDENFLEKLAGMEGGKKIVDAFHAFLDKYGMRCVGEIDITNARWSEKPAAIIPVILNNIKNFGPGEGKRKFEHGQQDALRKEQELLEKLSRLPAGEEKAKEAKQMISLMRNCLGYREYPKYHIVSSYFIYKKALLEEAGRLVESGIIREKEDIYYLSFEELRDVVRSGRLDYEVIDKRKDDYKYYNRLSPPRVMTSDGEIIFGEYQRKIIPANAIAGLPVSSGVAEGRARIIFKMEDADLEDGDILITPFADPSWTPLFVSIKGLVTEVGGLMTHGAVIAREYGLPAVVSVENATRLIRDGQRIRLSGTEGYVEILSIL